MSERSSPPAPDPTCQLLRHTLATLAYRGGKALRGAPSDFPGFRAGESTRTPGEILAHVGDLLDWALWMTRGEYRWSDTAPLPWNEEMDRFFARLEELDRALTELDQRAFPAERIFQGPIADAFTHVGQIAMLRRLHGSPVRGENYFRAEIETGRVGREQAEPVREFD